MTAQCFVPLRRYRRPIVAIAIALAVIQALAAGLAAAQEAGKAAIDPFSVAAICHSANAASDDTGGTPDTGSAWSVCCALCTVDLPAVVDHGGPVTSQVAPRHASSLTALPRDAALVALRAVRAGLSQGPPGDAFA